MLKTTYKVNNTSTKLIEVLLKSIDKLGIKKTIKVLEVSHKNTDKNKQLQDLVILNTCNKFGITHKTLIYGRQNIPDRTNAIGVCAILLSRLCKLTQREIGYILNKESTNINKYIKRYEHLDSSFKNDKEILIKITEIESACNEFYNS